MLKLKILKKYNFDVIILFLLILFGIKTLFYSVNFITYDELYSLVNYTNIYTVFLKDNLNNHIINSIIGTIVGISTYDISVLRLISFLSFILGVYIILQNQKSKYIIFIILICLIFGNNFFVYSFLYRGYSYYFLLFAIAFYFLEHSKNSRSSEICLIILSLLTFLAPSNILIIFPMIFFFKNKLGIKNILIYYLILTSIFLSINLIVTGLYELRDTINLQEMSLNIFFDLTLIFNIIFKGLTAYYNLIFGFYIERGLFDHLAIFIRDDKIILIFYIFFFLNIIYKILKQIKFDVYDKIFIIQIILLLALSNAPYARIYFPFYCFYILYFDRILSKREINFKFNKNVLLLTKTFLYIFLFLNISLEAKLTENVDINNHYQKIKISYKKFNPKYKNDCNLDYGLEDKLSRDIYYYKWLQDCDKKINLFELKKYQKIR